MSVSEFKVLESNQKMRDLAINIRYEILTYVSVSEFNARVQPEDLAFGTKILMYVSVSEFKVLESNQKMRDLAISIRYENINVCVSQ